jgi:hypothetical protein
MRKKNGEWSRQESSTDTHKRSQAAARRGPQMGTVTVSGQKRVQGLDRELKVRLDLKQVRGGGKVLAGSLRRLVFLQRPPGGARGQAGFVASPCRK